MKPFNGKKIIGKPYLPIKNKKLQEDPQVLFDALDKILSYDDVESIKWVQYTPYFNDGDVCEFGVCGALIRPKNMDPEIYNKDDYLEPWCMEYKNLPKDIQKTFHDFNELLTSESFDDMLYETFGDHAKVIATKDSIIIESFEHE